MNVSEAFAFVRLVNERVNKPEEKAMQTSCNAPLSIARITDTGTMSRVATSQVVSNRAMTPKAGLVKMKTCLSLEMEGGSGYGSRVSR